MQTITIEIEDDGHTRVTEDDGTGEQPEVNEYKSPQEASDAVSNILTNPQGEEQGEPTEPNEEPVQGSAPSQSMWDQEAKKRAMAKQDQMA